MSKATKTLACELCHGVMELDKGEAYVCHFCKRTVCESCIVDCVGDFGYCAYQQNMTCENCIDNINIEDLCEDCQNEC